MKTIIRSYASMLALVLIAGCASGGSQTNSPVTPAVPASPVTMIKTPAGHANLTIKFPTNFRTVAKSSGRVTAALRSTTYINPIANNSIAIWVDGTQIPGSPFVPQPLPDGTQLVSAVPVFSSSSNNIVVTESDASNNLLALGEYDYGNFTGGLTNSIALTMYMNVIGFAFTLNADGSSATLMNTITNPLCSLNPGNTSLFYVFPLDAALGFNASNNLSSALPITGLGGLPSDMTLTGSGTGQTSVGATLYSGIFRLTFDSPAGSSVRIVARATNPAYQLLNQSAPFNSSNNELLNNGGHYTSSFSALPVTLTTAGSMTLGSSANC